MLPERLPGAVGVNVTEKEQLPAAGRDVPQSLLWAKSPDDATEDNDREELPMFLSNTVCEEVAEPTGSDPNCRLGGARETAGAEEGPIFVTKTSVFPANEPWKAFAETGKSLDVVMPVTDRKS